MRRDLRLHDHAALATALAEEGSIQPIFIFDTDILARFDNPDDRRLTFITETLCQLDATLRTRGGGLLVLHGKATDILPKLTTAIAAKAIFSAEDFEPATRARDATVKHAVTGQARFVQVLDHLLRAPQRMLKADKTPYKVFTPFYKLWRADLGPAELAAYDINDHGRYADVTTIKKAAGRAGLNTIALESGPVHALEQIGYRYHKDTRWTVTDARDRLTSFIEQRLTAYPAARDQLDKTGTSELSPYLRHGLISIRECATAALGHGHGEKWLSELGWREFYAAILYHFPEVVTQEFTAHYRGTIDWNHDLRLQEALFTGRTGYPVIDAAARELLETGYMHNRARMIFASFATKDLLLDWRIGEAFFAQHLMDYELASNNGGWQWAASTGTDATPYFRIFNPLLQSKKFDPHGHYIRTYVPELRELSNADIHAPSPLTKPSDYPLPIVDHATAKDRAIAMFRAATKREVI